MGKHLTLCAMICSRSIRSIIKAAGDCVSASAMNDKAQAGAQMQYFGPDRVESPNQSDDEEDEQTAWQYARKYRLCQNYLAEDPLSNVAQLPLFPCDPTELDHKPEHLHILVEKLEVDSAATAILRSTICPPGEVKYLYLRRPCHPKKMEPPLLRTDLELDVLRFLKRVEPDLSSMILPFEPVDPEGDEGFDWPSSMLNISEMEEQKIWSEKIQIPRDTLLYLKEVLDDSQNNAMRMESIENRLPKRVCTQEYYDGASTNLQESLCVWEQ
jgi:hypothetical protein